MNLIQTILTNKFDLSGSSFPYIWFDHHSSLLLATTTPDCWLFCLVVEYRILDGGSIISSDSKLNKIQINPKFGPVRQSDRGRVVVRVPWTTLLEQSTELVVVSPSMCGFFDPIGHSFVRACFNPGGDRVRIQSLRISGTP